jgi:hypothetical protein
MDDSTMKLAFVNQGFDMILPPYQTSVGACTYGAACCLAKFSEVVVYGRQDSQNNLPADLVDRGVRFHFIPSSPRTTCFTRFGIGLLTAPESSSAWSFPEFGRQVAADLQKQRCDLIHVQHSSQHVPVIRAFNPDAKIVLHLHNFVVFDRPTLARRLRNVDLVTTVSDYVTQKIRHDFPSIADRVMTTYNGIDAVQPREGLPSYQPAGGEAYTICRCGFTS